MISARVMLSDYANKVLNVFKAQHGLKDKSEALNKFIEEHGTEEVEPVVKASYIRKLERIEKAHLKKHGYRHTPLNALWKEVEGK